MVFSNRETAGLRTAVTGKTKFIQFRQWWHTPLIPAATLVSHRGQRWGGMAISQH